jgi:hypothetical protein
VIRACRVCSVASSARATISVEKLPHVGRQHRAQLLERALEVVSKRRAGERLEQRPAEIQGAQLGDREAGTQTLERVAIHLPARAAVVARTIVEEREARFLERLEIAADRAGRHVAERRQLVDRDPGATGALDLAEDRPLANHFRVSRHLKPEDTTVTAAKPPRCTEAGPPL